MIDSDQIVITKKYLAFFFNSFVLNKRVRVSMNVYIIIKITII